MSFQVNTPVVLIQCQPYAVSWTGGTGPYFLSITKGGDVSSILKNVGQQTVNSYTWQVDEPVGTTVTFVVTDSKGQTATSAASPPVVEGSTDSCVKDKTPDDDATEEDDGDDSALPPPTAGANTTTTPPAHNPSKGSSPANMPSASHPTNPDVDSNPPTYGTGTNNDDDAPRPPPTSSSSSMNGAPGKTRLSLGAMWAIMLLLGAVLVTP